LRNRLLSRYGGEEAKDHIDDNDSAAALRPNKDRLNQGFIRPIDRQAEAIIGVYQSDLEASWGM
jgi:hypothetical protein